MAANIPDEPDITHLLKPGEKGITDFEARKRSVDILLQNCGVSGFRRLLMAAGFDVGRDSRPAFTSAEVCTLMEENPLYGGIDLRSLLFNGSAPSAPEAFNIESYHLDDPLNCLNFFYFQKIHTSEGPRYRLALGHNKTE